MKNTHGPSDQLNHVIDRTFSIFETTFEKFQHKKKLRLNWIDEKNNKCADHYVFILEKLLKCRTSKTFSTTSHQIKLAKLKILSRI